MENNNNINYKSLFLGSKGENNKYIFDLLNYSIQSSINARDEKNQDNPSYFENEYFDSLEHKNTVNLVEKNTKQLCEYLKETIQFSSLKYQAHMWGDNLIPSFIGYFSSLLYNNNPLQHQFSKKVFFLEYTAINDILKMIGYDMTHSFKTLEDFTFYKTTKEKDMENVKKDLDIIRPFGHIVNGGTIANIEAIWSSFFVKCMPVAIKNSILNKEFKNCNDIMVKQFGSDIEKNLLDLTNWELINLNNDVIVNLPYVISIKSNMTFDQVISTIKKYHVSGMGNQDYFISNDINQPIFLVTSTAHYSIEKAATLLGIGVKSLKFIQVDENGRMEIEKIKKTLLECIENKIPVSSIVALLGSTQESSVDNIYEILKIRDELRLNFSFNFDLHIDGAYGGYFRSFLNDSSDSIDNPPDKNIFSNNEKIKFPKQSFDPLEICNDYLKKQLNSIQYGDFVITDPHKTGYLPYSCGVISYRNSKYKDILTIATSYIGGSITSLGIHGIEGSRTGAPATALYLSHSIIRPSKIGYGYLLKKCLLNSKLLYFKLYHMGEINKNHFNISFACKPMTNEKYQFLKLKLLKPNNSNDLIDLNEIEENYSLLNELSAISSDLAIICFSCNLINNNQVNQNIDRYDQLNRKLMKKLGHYQDNDNEVELILSSTVFKSSYGPIFHTNLIDQIFTSDFKLNNDIDLIQIPCLRITTVDSFIGETNGGSFLNNMVNIIEKNILNSIKEL